MKKIPVGISSCLLGHEVRYDGGHKKNHNIEKTLGQYFTFVSFCPEVESGMGVPRPIIQLRKSEQGIRCVTVKDHSVDVTEQLLSCSAKQHEWLSGLSGYIFKKGSPSCGVATVKVFYQDKFDRVGTGVFAQYIKDNFPYLPMEDEERLGDAQLSENFFQRVSVLHRWQVLTKQNITPQKFVRFHRQHQSIALGHDQDEAIEIVAMASRVNEENVEQLADDYIQALMDCMTIKATN